jgi:hypothetical protein
VRRTLLAVLALSAPLPAGRLAAQAPDDPPPELAGIELRRSGSCVSTLEEVERLDELLDPLAARQRRLMSIAEAVALEERSVTAALDPSDALESDIRAWFSTDSLLAARYVDSGNEALQEQRRVGREGVKERIASAIAGIQQEADSIISATGDLMVRAGPCDGAVLVRPAVLEACGGRTTDLGAAAAAPADPESPYRFVDAPEDVWNLREVRPWTEPQPLRVGPQGLDGARTIGYARIGNVVVTAAFTPLFKAREQSTPAELLTFDRTNEALAITFQHPDIAFAPALALRAALPEPLGGEDRYLVHFGSADAPDVVWSTEAGSGAPLETSLPISPAHVVELRDGQPLTLTAMRGDDPVFSITLGGANQATAVGALLRYMSTQLDQDLRRIAPPSGNGG